MNNSTRKFLIAVILSRRPEIIKSGLKSRQDHRHSHLCIYAHNHTHIDIYIQVYIYMYAAILNRLVIANKTGLEFSEIMFVKKRS